MGATELIPVCAIALIADGNIMFPFTNATSKLRITVMRNMPLTCTKKHLPYLRNNYLLSSTDFTIVQSWWACLPLQYAQKSFIFANRALAVFSLSFFFLSLSLRVYWLLSDLLIVQCSSLSSSSSLQCRRFL